MLRHIVILGLVVMGSWIIQSADVRAEASTPATVIDSRTEGAATELHLSSKGEINTWTHDEDILGRDEGDIVEMQPGLERTAKTIKLENLVPPIHFGLGRVDIPDSYLALLRDVLENMRERENVRLHFVGHADNLPLVDELKTIYW